MANAAFGRRRKLSGFVWVSWMFHKAGVCFHSCRVISDCILVNLS